MEKFIVTTISGLLIALNTINPIISKVPNMVVKDIKKTTQITAEEKHEVVGFLPYWLLDQVDKDYSQYITTLTYFNLIVNPDGTILKGGDSGWYALTSGQADKYLNDAKARNVKLSLLVFNANNSDIYQLINNPIASADTLVDEVAPIMRRYGFTDLNLDIETTSLADSQSRQNFTIFVAEVKKKMAEGNLGTVTVDASPSVMFGNYLIDLGEVGKYADYVVLMAYDFHYAGSETTGPVAPVGDGQGFDTDSSIREAVKIIPKEKIILGIPLYGYGWSTWSGAPYASTIPGSGSSTSNRWAEYFAQANGYPIYTDDYAKESYLIYQDGSGAYRQIFFPNAASTSEKVRLANNYQIKGLALWALGYDGSTILNPLTAYKQNNNNNA